ncbi:Prohibitin-7 [Carex littledalei]|uniref:Prohibitin-7 n=1 Tax=Carex littledalei TaxID=544730 RepID=A0A833RA00_9POAL|nr:Prohibitin-7 [Carex littledalei]
MVFNTLRNMLTSPGLNTEETLQEVQNWMLVDMDMIPLQSVPPNTVSLLSVGKKMIQLYEILLKAPGVYGARFNKQVHAQEAERAKFIPEKAEHDKKSGIIRGNDMQI